jgi:hypothetical protein
MSTDQFATIATVALTIALAAAPAQTLPRTADGKPDFQGIWQASGTAAADLQDHAARFNMPAGRSVVTNLTSAAIPYQPWAAAKKAENFQNREKADPLGKCYIPGVPRVMYLDFPFQIFQTPQVIAMTFEWSLDYRLIYTNDTGHPPDTDGWMGDSRGHWDGDTFVVDVGNNNDKTWFDMAGDFHSDALHVVERYRMTDPDTIQYQATIEDSKVFTKPWTISLPLHRRKDRDRLFEYACEAEAEEANGAFEREKRTWYPGDGTPPPAMTATPARAVTAPKAVTNIRRTADDKPDLQGFYESNAGGANYGLEKHPGGLAPAGRGVIVDPPDGKLPMQPWAVAELADRQTDARGYDDPTAHCFPAGVPRSMYVPVGLDIIQTRDYIVFLHERTSWRIVRLESKANGASAHLPDSIRLWQGDSVGRWDGDTLVIDTANLNGKTWLNEAGEIVSYAEHVVERFTPIGPDALNYEATVTDPVVYTRPWTITFPFRREKFELGEAACHEEDHDLPHLKAIRDAARKK